MKKNTLNLEEHKELGLILKNMQRRLFDLSENYKTKKEYRASLEFKALKYLEKLKNILDEILFRDFPEESTYSLAQIYYEEYEK